MEIITEKNFERQKPDAPASPIVKIVNFSKTPFTWTWNKIPYTFLPREENAKFMDRSIAVHFAKHLVNRELIERGREGDTSPKKPEENPYFMELFNRCIFEVNTGSGEIDQTKLEQDAIDLNMKSQMSKKGIKGVSRKKPATKKAETPAVPDEAEIALMTGQSVHKKITSKPASKEDEEFEVVEPPEDEDEA